MNYYIYPFISSEVKVESSTVYHPDNNYIPLLEAGMHQKSITLSQFNSILKNYAQSDSEVDSILGKDELEDLCIWFDKIAIIPIRHYDFLKKVNEQMPSSANDCDRDLPDMFNTVVMNLDGVKIIDFYPTGDQSEYGNLKLSDDIVTITISVEYQPRYNGANIYVYGYDSFHPEKGKAIIELDLVEIDENLHDLITMNHGDCSITLSMIKKYFVEDTFKDMRVLDVAYGFHEVFNDEYDLNILQGSDS